MSANAPIAMKEVLTLSSVGINAQHITFTHVTMESDKYICLRENTPHNSIVIMDISMSNQPLRRPITDDSSLMNPNSRILALKALLQGTTQDHLQIFNIELKTKMKSHQIPEKWLVLIGIAPGSPERPQLVKGNMQLFSVDQQHSQALEAHAASFSQLKVPGNENPSVLISFSSKTLNAVSMQISHKYSLIYVITKLGLLFVYDLETATVVYRNRISPDP
ncbi:hypothetical protein RYX36_025338, partial [Vicia faba]